MIAINIEDVIAIHDAILETEKGVSGYHGDNRLGGALSRIQFQLEYGDVNDIFDIAAWYVEAIAMGHCFADANKRTALTTALTFLEWNEVSTKTDDRLASVVEDLVKKEITRDDLATIFSNLVLD